MPHEWNRLDGMGSDYMWICSNCRHISSQVGTPDPDVLIKATDYPNTGEYKPATCEELVVYQINKS